MSTPIHDLRLTYAKHSRTSNKVKEAARKGKVKRFTHCFSQTVIVNEGLRVRLGSHDDGECFDGGGVKHGWQHGLVGK